jgi:hypothetical protein
LPVGVVGLWAQEIASAAATPAAAAPVSVMLWNLVIKPVLRVVTLIALHSKICSLPPAPGKSRTLEY